jgi:hypothetical protein
VHDAVVTAARPVPGSSVVEVLEFEILSSTEWAFGFPSAFEPDVFVDVSETFNTKIEALKMYGPELRPSPHPRSIENVMALAKFRGSTIGVEATEAFHLVYSRR